MGWFEDLIGYDTQAAEEIPAYSDALWDPAVAAVGQAVQQGGNLDWGDIAAMLPQAPGLSDAEYYGGMEAPGYVQPGAATQAVADYYAPEQSGGWLQSIENAGQWLDKNKTAASLGLGGLAFLSGIPAAKRNAALQKQAMEEAMARRAMMNARFDKQLNTSAADIAAALPAAREWAGTQGPTVASRYGRGAGALPSAYKYWKNNNAAVTKAEGGYLEGGTAGQDDKIPAMLSDGEYVMDADTVAALGDGNNAAGAAKLDEMRENIRTHKRSAPANKIPPKAKGPLAYMKKAKGKKNG